MACVALPTCGLAMAESERYLPTLLEKMGEALAEAAGCRERGIVVRMTGCPNGCARPFVAEIGLVGKALGKYNLYLGAISPASGSTSCTARTSTRQRSGVLRPIVQRFAQERQPGGAFWRFLRAGRLCDAGDPGLRLSQSVTQPALARSRA